MQPINKHLLKTAVLFGFPAGLVVISSMIAGFALTDGKGPGSSQVFGSIIMLLAFTLIFMGVRHHRKNALELRPGFGRTFTLGTLIALCAGVAYVLVWELYLYLTDYGFIENYIANLIDVKQTKGFSPAELELEIGKLDKLRQLYLDPLKRIPITFIEIFPLGVAVALFCSIYYRIADHVNS